MFPGSASRRGCTKLCLARLAEGLYALIQSLTAEFCNAKGSNSDASLTANISDASLTAEFGNAKGSNILVHLFSCEACWEILKVVSSKILMLVFAH